jgi:hypothetical protein
MNPLIVLFSLALSSIAPGQYELAPTSAHFDYPGHESLQVTTQDSRLTELIVSVHGEEVSVPAAELEGLPRIFIDTVRYNLPETSTSARREVSMDGGDRGDPFASPPIPAKIIELVFSFEGDAYRGWMTTTPIDDTTSEVWSKAPGEPKRRRAKAVRIAPQPLRSERPTREDHNAEQGGAGEPATRSESDSQDGDKPQPEAEGRSR